jgi:hypothetical protein
MGDWHFSPRCGSPGFLYLWWNKNGFGYPQHGLSEFMKFKVIENKILAFSTFGGTKTALDTLNMVNGNVGE